MQTNGVLGIQRGSLLGEGVFAVELVIREEVYVERGENESNKCRYLIRRFKRFGRSSRRTWRCMDKE